MRMRERILHRPHAPAAPTAAGGAARRAARRGRPQVSRARAAADRRRLTRLLQICHRRWFIPVLAELHALTPSMGGAKFITLVNRLHLSRDCLRATLEDLIAMGLVARNPGYGHPMRPEYVLTGRGRALGRPCARLARVIEYLEAQPIALRKWSMPVLLALANDVTRFNGLRAGLPGVTARALTLALKDLIGGGLASRRVHDGYPPGTSYHPTSSGRRLCKHIRVLARSLEHAS